MNKKIVYITLAIALVCFIALVLTNNNNSNMFLKKKHASYYSTDDKCRNACLA